MFPVTKDDGGWKNLSKPGPARAIVSTVGNRDIFVGVVGHDLHRGDHAGEHYLATHTRG